MGEIVDIRGRSIPIEDDELIEDLARYADGTLSETAVKSGITSVMRTGRRLARMTSSSSLSRLANFAGYAPGPPSASWRNAK